MTLYDLANNYITLMNEMESEEGLDEGRMLELLDTGEAIEDKADNIARLLRNEEAEIIVIKEEENRLATRRRVIQNSVDRLKEYLKSAMIATGKTKFKTNLFSFAVQKNGGAAPVYLRVPEEQIPDEFMKITRTPDKKAMADYINETGDVTLFDFAPRGESLRIR